MEIQMSEEVSPDYLAEVQHIFADREFLSLGQFVHHQWTNRLMHSINVSYLSWLMARKLGCDEKAAARAGLLHDFCPYDFKEKTPTGEFQAFFHPKAAAENSLQSFAINKREMDAILSHMFPLGPVPKNKEAWIITVADKVCAVMEVCHVAIALARRNRVVIMPVAA
ncbi:MAG: HD domain-containing protein [Clostridiales bacterium]|nr:HD domain-containing protein [Clostridiales bacterium]